MSNITSLPISRATLFLWKFVILLSYCSPRDDRNRSLSKLLSVRCILSFIYVCKSPGSLRSATKASSQPVFRHLRAVWLTDCLQSRFESRAADIGATARRPKAELRSRAQEWGGSTFFDKKTPATKLRARCLIVRQEMLSADGNARRRFRAKSRQAWGRGVRANPP